jgi:hypothetical protein
VFKKPHWGNSLRLDQSRRGAADCGEYCQVAGVIAEVEHTAPHVTVATCPEFRFPPPWSVEDIGATNLLLIVRQRGRRPDSMD